MAMIHFLNVKEGDCSIIQHNSGHVTVIDVCNAKPLTRESIASQLIPYPAVKGNFGQKEWPVNPIEYMKGREIHSIFRYIQTHPDMDHMDGIQELFNYFKPVNFWDTNNTKELDLWTGSPYDRNDWYFYKNLRDNNPSEDPRRLALLSGSKGQYWNVGEDGSQGGDGLQILAPTPELLVSANANGGDYNDCSYVILYRTNGMKAIFAGDSHDETWNYIISKHKSEVRDIDLLIAPHHGRDSDRNYEFLDTLMPTMTLFGNARHEYLAYDQWNRRNLAHITNNQANCVIIDADRNPWHLYVTNEVYARQAYPQTSYNATFKAWPVYDIYKR